MPLRWRPCASSDQRTQAYAGKLHAKGESTKDVSRYLKGATARESWHLLVHPDPVPRTDDMRDRRHQHDLTLAQVAKKLDTVPARISELERGKRPNADLATDYRQWLTAA